MFKWLTNLFKQKVIVKPTLMSLISIKGKNDSRLIKDINERYLAKIKDLTESNNKEKKIKSQILALIKQKTKKQKIVLLKERLKDFKLEMQAINIDDIYDPDLDNATFELKRHIEKDLLLFLTQTLDEIINHPKAFSSHGKELLMNAALNIKDKLIPLIAETQQDLLLWLQYARLATFVQKKLAEVEGKSKAEIEAEYHALPGAGGLSVADELGRLSLDE
jgi:hypothetical protein